MLLRNFLEQSDEILDILYWILGIGAAWIVLRFILKIAKKVFTIGCIGILVVGFAFMLLNWLQVL